MVKELCAQLQLLPDKGNGDRSEIEQYKVIVTTEGLESGNRFEITILDTDKAVDNSVCQVYLKEEEAKLMMAFFRHHIVI